MGRRARCVFAGFVAWAAMPAAVVAQEAGRVGTGVSLAASGMRMVFSLLAVLAILALCAWALRRWREHRSLSSESIEIISGIALGAKERVVLLKVGDEQVLVGLSPAGMSSLHVIKDSSPRFTLGEDGAQ